MKSFQTLLVYSLLLTIPVIAFCQSNNELKFARALEKSGRYEEALNLYYKMYEGNDHRYQIIDGISNCLTGLRRYDDLIDFFQKLLINNPGHYNYRIELAKAYYLNGNEDEAFKHFRQVYENAPNNAMAYRLVGHALIGFRLLDRAIEVYQKAVNVLDDQKTLYRDIANLYKAQLDYYEATTNLLFFYKYFNRQANYVKSQLISMSKDDESVEKIINAIQNFMANEFSDDMIQEFLATMYVKNKEYDKAFKIYNRLKENKNNPSFLLAFAELVEKNKVYRYAVLAYETLIKSYKSDKRVYQFQLDLARNYYKLAMQQVSNNQQEKAKENILKSISILDEISKLDMIMYRIYSLELKGDIYNEFYRDLDQAISIYERILEENKRLEAVDHIKVKLGHAYLAKNNLKESRKYYSDIKGKKYRNIGLYNLAELDYFEGRFSSAKRKYERLISEIASNDSLVNNALERNILISQYASDSLDFAEYAKADLLDRQLKKSEAAKKFLEILQKQNKLSFKSGLYAGQIYVQLGKYQESKAIFNTLIERYPENDGIDRVYYLLAEVYYLQKDYKNGLQYYRQILLSYPTSFYLEDARDKARLLSGLIKEDDDQ